MKKLVVLLMLFSAPCFSQDLQKMKQYKVKVFDKKFWFATAVIVGTTILDTESTYRCTRNHTCREGNPIYGRFPRRGRLYGIHSPAAAFTIWGTWYLKKYDMIDQLAYQHRFDDDPLHPKLWDKPTPSWYLAPLMWGGITGGVGIANLRHQTSPTRLPAQPAIMRPN